MLVSSKSSSITVPTTDEPYDTETLDFITIDITITKIIIKLTINNICRRLFVNVVGVL
jgi:hypothetical protein